DAVAAGVRGLVLVTSHVRVATQSRNTPTRPFEQLALALARVGLGAPPGRSDRGAAVRRQDQIDAGLVHPLPDLPPRRRAAVAEREVDGRDDREDLRRPDPRALVRRAP